MPATPPEPGAILGVLLAGGRSSRMGGGDKCLRRLGGETILARIIARVRPQVDQLVLNAAGDGARFAAYGLEVIPDVIAGFGGPLVGVLSGMEWALARAPRWRWIVTVPTDAPFVPKDLVARLRQGLNRDGAELACAASGGRAHPVVGLWPVALAGALRAAIVDEEMRKIDLWTARFALAQVAFEDSPTDPFFNVNTPADLAAAERLLA